MWSKYWHLYISAIIGTHASYPRITTRLCPESGSPERPTGVARVHWRHRSLISSDLLRFHRRRRSTRSPRVSARDRFQSSLDRSGVLFAYLMSQGMRIDPIYFGTFFTCFSIFLNWVFDHYSAYESASEQPITQKSKHKTECFSFDFWVLRFDLLLCTSKYESNQVSVPKRSSKKAQTTTSFPWKKKLSGIWQTNGYLKLWEICSRGSRWGSSMVITVRGNW